jgi:hypothetical protein
MCPLIPIINTLNYWKENSSSNFWKWWFHNIIKIYNNKWIMNFKDYYNYTIKTYHQT